MPLIDHFKHINLTGGQIKALAEIETFLHGDKDVFILKGYAGTGKTTLLKGIISYLSAGGFQNFSDWDIYNTELPEKTFQVMAPTGRAANIIKEKTGFDATTIHKGIYNFNELHTEEESQTGNKDKDKTGFKFFFSLAPQRPSNAIILVDEASMISDKFNEDLFFRFGTGYLLKDLIDYAGFHFKDNKPKIIFIGDPAQLPPVNMKFSPALDEKHLSKEYQLSTQSYELDEVVRQDKAGNILKFANQIRKNLIPYHFKSFNIQPNGNDIFNFSISDFYTAYASLQNKIIITYENKTAYDLNQYIRNKRFNNQGQENLPIQKGDIVLVAANNYKYQVMNGEFGVVAEVSDIFRDRLVHLNAKGGKIEAVRLKWRKIKILFDKDKITEGFMLDTFLTSNSSNLSDIERQALYVDFKMRHENLLPNSNEFKESLKNDLLFNALQIKYGYAVTCHKAQGGEWDNVFVDFNDFSQGLLTETFYRWSYTALTRASKHLYAHKPPYFHSFSNMTFRDVIVQNTYAEFFNMPDNIIKINPEHHEILKKLNTENLPENLQHHIIKMYELLHKHQIEIVFYKILNYEIRAGFKKDDKKVAIKFWRNSKNHIKDKHQKIPKYTNSDQLFDLISFELQKLPQLFVEPDFGTQTNIKNNFEFEPEIAEEKPVLKTLYDKLSDLLQIHDIKIYFIEHLNYRERYTFSRQQEKAVVDFLYKDDAFFGSVIPIDNQCNSQKLLDNLKQIIEIIKQ